MIVNSVIYLISLLQFLEVFLLIVSHHFEKGYNIQQAVLIALQELPLEKQQEVLNFVKFLTWFSFLPLLVAIF